MNLIETLLARFSTDALKAPAPTDQQLHMILSTAMRAPDHGRLRPWRFVVIKEEQRHQWAETVRTILIQSETNYPETYIHKITDRFEKMPMTLALGMRHITKNTSIAFEEQLMATSSAIMNVLNGLYATGFSGKWITGPVQEPGIISALGMQSPYHLLGFLFLGTPNLEAKKPERAVVDPYVTFWQGKPVKFEVDIE